MKKCLCIISVIILLLTNVGIIASAERADEMDAAYHIYVDGNREGENVFATIEEAKEYVRTLPKDKGDIIVEIADGIYELDKTVFFDKEDSGSENCQIRYIAAQGAKPVISGGRTVSGEWQSEGENVYCISLDRSEKLRSLYINGKRCYMTSKVIKGQGAVGEYTVKDGSEEWAWADGTRSSGILFSGNAINVNTINQDDIELMTQTRWNTTIVCVENLEKQGLKVRANLQMPYAAIAQTLGWGNEYQFKQNNMAYNVFEWLENPGEFYFDKTEKKLYYIPREGEDLNTAEVVVPTLETIISVEGENKENQAQHISFEGLSFEYSDWNLCNVGDSHGRATNQGAATLFAYAQEDWHSYIYRAYDVGPGAVEVTSANNIKFIGNTIAHTGNDGLSLINDCSEIDVSANTIYDTAGATLLIGHPQHEYIGDKNSDKGVLSDKEKYDIDVEAPCRKINVNNNLFKDTSRLFWGVAGVMVYMVEEMDFTHNQIENTPYSGISLGWGWWNMNGDDDAVVPGVPSTTMKNNTIKYNKFLNTITTLSDAGAIYTIGDMPGTVISENYIKDIGSPYSNNAFHIRGIHIDEGTKNVYGEKNVIDIDPSCACIDCGDWGRKGNNTWVDNYSTSDSYSTEENYEQGTVIKNEHYVPDAAWDENAQAVIDNSGIQSEFISLISADVMNSENEIMKAIPKYKVNIPLIVGLSVAGLAVVVTGAALIIRRKLKKKSK